MFPSQGTQDFKVGYALGVEDLLDSSAFDFTEGLIDADGVDSLLSPSVAFNGDPCDPIFVVTAVEEDGSDIYASFYSGGFTDWDSIASTGGAFSRPTVVRGETDEFYVIASENDSGAGFAYMRSTNAGASWYTDDVKVNNQRVLGVGPAETAVYQDGHLYVAYMYERSASARKIRFLRGTDSGSGMTFEQLKGGAQPGDGPPISVPVTLTTHKGDVRSLLPGTFGQRHHLALASGHPLQPHVHHVHGHEFRGSGRRPDADLVRGLRQPLQH